MDDLGQTSHFSFASQAGSSFNTPSVEASGIHIGHLPQKFRVALNKVSADAREAPYAASTL